jgi:CheY-like chemotaxis protein
VTEAVSADSAEDVTVLVVDDQPPNLRLMDAVLSPRGYKVIAVESGQKALTALKESPIDVVLLDIVMPGMDGHEVCRQIRADEATHSFQS